MRVAGHSCLAGRAGRLDPADQDPLVLRLHAERLAERRVLHLLPLDPKHRETCGKPAMEGGKRELGSEARVARGGTVRTGARREGGTLTEVPPVALKVPDKVLNHRGGDDLRPREGPRVSLHKGRGSNARGTVPCPARPASLPPGVAQDSPRPNSRSQCSLRPRP